MKIREAVDSDWLDIWRFMQPILAAGDTYCWPADRTEDAARRWWMDKPGGRVLVAIVDDAVVGTAEFHPNQPAGGSHVANAGFMVSPCKPSSFGSSCPMILVAIAGQAAHGWYGGASPQPQRGMGACSTMSRASLELCMARRVPHSA